MRMTFVKSWVKKIMRGTKTHSTAIERELGSAGCRLLPLDRGLNKSDEGNAEYTVSDSPRVDLRRFDGSTHPKGA
jgi:hypothetical protein